MTADPGIPISVTAHPTKVAKNGDMYWLSHDKCSRVSVLYNGHVVIQCIEPGLSWWALNVEQECTYFCVVKYKFTAQRPHLDVTECIKYSGVAWHTPVRTCVKWKIEIQKLENA